MDKITSSNELKTSQRIENAFSQCAFSRKCLTCDTTKTDKKLQEKLTKKTPNI